MSDRQRDRSGAELNGCFRVPCHPCAGHTDRGGKRINQDHLAWRVWPEGALYVVTDGVGSYRGAEWMAREIAEAALDRAETERHRFAREPEAAMRALFVAAVATARERIRKERPDLGPRTTAVVAWASPTALVLGHVGDSRGYRFDASGIRFHTRDHSLARELIDGGALDAAAAAHHPAQRQLTRSLGLDQPAEVEVSVQAPLAPGEALLLCSDGVWAEVDETAIRALASAPDPADAVRRLVETAVARAGANPPARNDDPWSRPR